jgi:hypothetical protein
MPQRCLSNDERIGEIKSYADATVHNGCGAHFDHQRRPSQLATDDSFAADMATGGNLTLNLCHTSNVVNSSFLRTSVELSQDNVSQQQRRRWLVNHFVDPTAKKSLSHC